MEWCSPVGDLVAPAGLGVGVLQAVSELAEMDGVLGFELDAVGAGPGRAQPEMDGLELGAAGRRRGRRLLAVSGLELGLGRDALQGEVEPRGGDSIEPGHIEERPRRGATSWSAG